MPKAEYKESAKYLEGLPSVCQFTILTQNVSFCRTMNHNIEYKHGTQISKCLDNHVPYEQDEQVYLRRRGWDEQTRMAIRSLAAFGGRADRGVWCGL